MKKILLVTLLSLALLPYGGFAESSSSQAGSSGSGAGSVGSIVTLPPTDPDEIMQFNNLTVQSVSGDGSSATIYSYRDVGSACRNYKSLDAAYGVPMPCPDVPTLLYAIHVNGDTRLLLRDRTKATIDDFTEGDQINVFGFVNGDNEIDALIVRNITKPTTYRYLQLNNVEIISGPLPTNVGITDGDAISRPFPALPAQIVVAKKFPTPCLGFRTESSSGLIVPCPVPEVQIPAMVSDSMPVARYPYRTYTVLLTTKTSIVNRLRQAISVADLAVGHRVNVYGRVNSATGNIEAVVLRDISLPTSGKGTLRVQAVDTSIVCITTPCGIVTSAKVSLYRANGVLVGTGSTGKGEAVFDGLAPGKYVVKVEASGYGGVKQEVELKEGATESVVIPLSRVRESALHVLSPNGGEVLTRGIDVSIRWTSRTLTVKPVTFDIFLMSYGASEKVFTIAKGLALDPARDVQSYTWTVPNTLEKILLGDGAYFVKVCVSGSCFDGSSLADRSDEAFQVVTSGSESSVKIDRLTPSRGVPGTIVKIVGNGFDSIRNTVYFGEDFTVDAKTDGDTILFTVPTSITPACYLKRADVSTSDAAKQWIMKPIDPPCAIASYLLSNGVYKVWVVNKNGTSNTVSFTVMREDYPIPVPVPMPEPMRPESGSTQKMMNAPL